MKINHIPYPTESFSWKKNHGVAEASDLRLPLGKTPGHLLYDDSTDYGFYVRGNSKTVMFIFTDYDKTPDGEDVAGFKYVSECSEFSILIINS